MSWGFAWGGVRGGAIGGDACKAVRASCRDLLEESLGILGRGLGFFPVEASARTGDAVLVAAVQIDVEHGTIVAQKDLEVDLQARMRLHHGCDQDKALVYPLAKLGLIWRVCDEAFDDLGRELKFAFQRHALGIWTRANPLHGMQPRGVIACDVINLPVAPARVLLSVESFKFGVQVRRLFTRHVCEKRRSSQQMIHSKVRSQLLGPRPSSAVLREIIRRRSHLWNLVSWPEESRGISTLISVRLREPPTLSHEPALVLTLRREKALPPAALGSVRHTQRVPTEPTCGRPSMHAAHCDPLVCCAPFVLARPVGRGRRLATRTQPGEQSRHRERGVKDQGVKVEHRVVQTTWPLIRQNRA
eukprot:scaffold104787_cov75-Phaeocystis_antarctica.AAC.1